MKKVPVALLTLGLLAGGACAGPDPADGWYAAGQTAVAARLAEKPNRNRARNVILFIGDGMGVSTVTAARIYDGQSRGESGEENVLPFETFPHTALVKTYNTNQQVSDSAGTATAMNTGVKTRAGVLGISGEAHRANCREALDHAVPTLGELAEEASKSTGIVTTTRITHATPAAVYAHTSERDWEADGDLPDDARAEGCRSIARQLVEFDAGDGIDVAFGGGRKNFTPSQIAAWKAHYPDGALIEDRNGLAALDPAKTHRVFGLFAKSHMTFMQDRTGNTTEPTLSEMTAKAIDILSRNPKGYYLMVEGGRIDHGSHAGVAGKALSETQEFARAVKVALDKVDLDDTLILVTADHSHVLTMAGYPTRGNPILGLVIGNDKHGEPATTPKLAGDGKPYTTLGYHNGPGAVEGARPVPDTAPGAHQQALVPTLYHSAGHAELSETHGGEDVALYAAGPWSELASGVIEQNVIFHIIAHAYGWDTK